MGFNIKGSFTRNSGEAVNDRFEVQKITDPNDPLLKKYYEEFSKIFILDEIRRSFEGLQTWLKTNENQDLQKKNGPTEHSILALVDKNTGDVVGGWDHVKFLTGSLNQESTQGLLGGTQGTYVWVKDGYRKKDGIGFDSVSKLKETAIADTEEWTSIETKKNSEGRTFTYFEHEDPLRLTIQERDDDIAAAGIEQAQRVKTFIKNLGAQVIQDPKGGGWYAQTAYPEVGAKQINQTGAADYLTLTAICPERCRLTNDMLKHGINSVAGVLATDNGSFETSDHNVIGRMNEHLGGNTRTLNLIKPVDELILLKEDIADYVASNKGFEGKIGEGMGLPPIDSPMFMKIMSPRVAKNSVSAPSSANEGYEAPLAYIA